MNISICVCTPAFGGQLHCGYFTSILKLERMCRDLGITIDYEMLYNESLISRARNTLANRFLESKYTHLLFIDSDIEFDANDIIQMLNANKPIIGGIYPKKSINWEHLANTIAAHKGDITSEMLKKMSHEYVAILLKDEDIYKNESIIEARYVGTGMLLVQRIVFDKMMEAHPNDQYTHVNGTHFRFFDTEVKYGVYLSEDYWFCERWRNLGGQIFLKKDCNTKHWGSIPFG